MSYQNGLSVAGSNTTFKIASQKRGARTPRTTRISADELDKRFSFQSYGEDTGLEAVCPGAARRALLDKRLLEQLYEQLALRSGLETKDMSLLAHNGVVTIMGTVADRAMRTELCNFLRECSPVKTVVNRLKIRSDNDHANGIQHTADWQAPQFEQWQRHDMAA